MPGRSHARSGTQAFHLLKSGWRRVGQSVMIASALALPPLLAAGCAVHSDARPTGSSIPRTLAAAAAVPYTDASIDNGLTGGRVAGLIIAGKEKTDPHDIAPELFSQQPSLRGLVASALLSRYAPAGSRHGTLVADIVGGQDVDGYARIYAVVSSASWVGGAGGPRVVSSHGPFHVRITTNGLYPIAVDAPGEGALAKSDERRLFPLWAQRLLDRAHPEIDASSTALAKALVKTDQ